MHILFSVLQPVFDHPKKFISLNTYAGAGLTEIYRATAGWKWHTQEGLVLAVLKEQSYLSFENNVFEIFPS